MLLAGGFSCCVVDSKQHTKVLHSTERISEERKYRMASTWLGGVPSDKPDPPLSIGIYIGRDTIQPSSRNDADSENCMIYFFRNGRLVLGPQTLKSLEKAPIILAAPHNRNGVGENFSGWTQNVMMTLCQLEVIIMPAWVAPIPLMRPDQFARSYHLAYFRFTSLSTQQIKMNGIAIMPKDFWVHEREISVNWEPLSRRRPVLETSDISRRHSITMRGYS